MYANASFALCTANLEMRHFTGYGSTSAKANHLGIFKEIMAKATEVRKFFN
jgi:hypothetical protein